MAAPAVKSIVVGGPVLMNVPKSPVLPSSSKSPLQPRVLFKTNEPPVDKEVLRQLLEEDDLVEISGANFTPRKRRHTKVKEQLDESFLRRSKRLSGLKAGFKDVKSAKEAEEIGEPVPLAIIPAPGSAPAPHLNMDAARGIAEGFLRIHPSVVSAALLEEDVNNDSAK